jgi:hypothetical protein
MLLRPGLLFVLGLVPQQFFLLFSLVVLLMSHYWGLLVIALDLVVFQMVV